MTGVRLRRAAALVVTAGLAIISAAGAGAAAGLAVTSDGADVVGAAPLPEPSTSFLDVEILAFDATYDLATDGTLDVVETIAVLYRSDRRGIFRDIPVIYDLAGPIWFELPDGAPSDWQRVLEIDDIRVTSTTAPDDIEVTRPNRLDNNPLNIRIGDEDVYISGTHVYEIAYTVRGALNATDVGTELYWNVTGNGWVFPLARATATFRGPGLDTSRFACFRGGNYSSLPCERAGPGDGGVTMAADRLDAFEGMTAVVVFDPAVVPAPDPLLRRRWTPVRALWGSPWAWPLAVLTAVVAFGGVGRLLWRQGRDRIARGGVTIDQRHDPEPSEVPRPLSAPFVSAVEYRPPDDLRPAELGLIVDERVDPVDISATVVDLAVRGYLTITEVEKKKLLVFTSNDWKLTKVDRDHGSVHNYERMLLGGLFADGDEVLVGDLKGSFADDYGKVERAIYEQGRKRRWFNARPDKERAKWRGIGAAAFVGSGALFAAAFFLTEFAIAAVPVLLAAVVLFANHHRMPHRTAKGSEMLRRTLGFREFISAAETDRMQFAERENLFVDYLPYAVVFGATEKWAQTFADLGVDTAAAVGGFWYGHHHGASFDAGRFSNGIADFSSTIGTSLSTVPSSSGGSGFSGGGFSGGGMGGGGGGSW